MKCSSNQFILLWLFFWLLPAAFPSNSGWELRIGFNVFDSDLFVDEEDQASVVADQERKHEELEPQVDESALASILEVPADEALKEEDGGESEAKRQRVDVNAGEIVFAKGFNGSEQTQTIGLENVGVVSSELVWVSSSLAFVIHESANPHIGWCSHW
ncbi:hypothetical protein J5N97_022738 [Dioscorea zingiberensis]|uniref:Uncharacterized protein n=1 Tax=Dioscorea zingiberensis TaxID=325984 RepID=A0A9D5CAP4_9LILI|nr:hypothetical protein J5N97_022738 [Dioscorea zingiberensis]